MKRQKSPEKSTFERLSEILPTLDKDQLRYIVALQEHPSKKDACNAIGLKPNTIYKWGKNVDEAARLIALESIHTTVMLRKRSIIKAMLVKISGLDSNDEGVRQKTATELIEWELGKAKSPVDVTTDGKEIKSNDEQIARSLSEFAHAIGAILSKKDQ